MGAPRLEHYIETTQYRVTYGHATAYITGDKASGWKVTVDGLDLPAIHRPDEGSGMDAARQLTEARHQIIEVLRAKVADA